MISRASSLILILILILDLYLAQKDKIEKKLKNEPKSEVYKLLVFTVGTERTDGYLRYLRSTQVFSGLYPITLGMNEEWIGGDVQHFPGGGQKINLLRSALMPSELMRHHLQIIKEQNIPIKQHSSTSPTYTTSSSINSPFLSGHDSSALLLATSKQQSADDSPSYQVTWYDPFKTSKLPSQIINNPFHKSKFFTLSKDPENSEDIKDDEISDAQNKNQDWHDVMRNVIVLFTDSYDVIFNGDALKIVESFLNSKAGILFSSEVFCWPDSSLVDSYPKTTSKNRFLNSGAFIGFYHNLTYLLQMSDMENIMNNKPQLTDIIEPDEDDQLYYTRAFLNPDIRERLKIKLDYKNALFQSLNGIPPEELKLVTYSDKNDQQNIEGVMTLVNTVHKTRPTIIHGNGDSKIYLNYLSNYIPRAWAAPEGCLSCRENMFALRSKPLVEYPIVFLHLHVEKPTPFYRQALEKISKLDYPKNRIVLDIFSKVEYHDKHIEAFLTKYGNLYLDRDWARFPSSIDPVSPNAPQKIPHERDIILSRFWYNQHNPSYFFNIDSDVHIDNPKTLILLIEQNRSVIAPLLARPGKMWTNFWGALSPTGFYARSDNYVDIVTFKQQGIFNVPFINSAYLIQRQKIATWLISDGKQYKNSKFETYYEPPLIGDPELLDPFQEDYASNDILAMDEDSRKINNQYTPDFNVYTYKTFDSDMAFCRHMRQNGDFMYLTNMHVYGHLIDADYYDTKHTHNDLYQIFDNPKDWEETYIHPDWRKQLDPEFKIAEPCPDVYWFPVLNDLFCDELIEEMEILNEWSGGKHEDKRLSGGYENVPTDDVHLTQIGLERHWLHFLKMYISPIQLKLYPGYVHDPPEALLNFVVRYKPTAQSFLRPHHDSSTYTINIALNRYKHDYEGGGVRFIRYNCSVVDTRKGWSFIHPGRLTHYHEGLLITKGTRYLMVSFVDP